MTYSENPIGLLSESKAVLLRALTSETRSDPSRRKAETLIINVLTLSLPPEEVLRDPRTTFLTNYLRTEP